MNLTGQDLAKMAEISPAYLSEVERGLSGVSGEKLFRIAGSLGVSMQSLIEGTVSISHVEGEVIFPAALAAAADQLGWSYRTMASLYAAKQSLVSRRSSKEKEEWGMEEWIKFHGRLKDYLEP